jgi:hypothetical protein
MGGVAGQRGISASLRVAGIVLVLAFLFLHWQMPFAHHDAAGALHAIELFFAPGLELHPEQWVLGQVIQFSIAAAGLFCIAFAARPRHADIHGAVRRLSVNWRQALWAVLLGQYATGLVSAIIWRIDMPAAHIRENSSLLGQIESWLGLVLPVFGLAACARLLFATRRRSSDRWLGTVMAATALFGLALTLLGIAGINDLMVAPEHARSLPERLWDSSFDIVFGVAASWTGLFLARRPDVTSGAGRAGLIAYLVAATILFGTALGALLRTGMLFETFSPPAALYALAAAFFLGLTLLVLAHAVDLLHEAAPDPRSRMESQPIVRSHSWGALSTQAAVGLAVSAGSMAAGYFWTARVPLELAAFMMPAILAALFAGPVLVFIYGFLRGRIGYSLGAALLIVGLVGYRAYNLVRLEQNAKAAVAEAASLDIYPFQEPKQKHAVVAIIDSGARGARTAGCGEHCRLALLSSPYLVAVEEAGKPVWHIHRLVHDHDFCMAQERLLDNTLEFMQAGFPDTCSAETVQASGPDALIIRENVSDTAPIRKRFPKRFRGNAYEFLERIDGRDTLLGRVVWGGVQPPMFSHQPGRSATFEVDEPGFYAAALKLPDKRFPPISVENAKRLLPIYLELLQQQEYGSVPVHNSWVGFMEAAQKSEARTALRDAIVSWFQSGDLSRMKVAVSSFAAVKSDLGLPSRAS